jgi:hypothetical protein
MVTVQDKEVDLVKVLPLTGIARTFPPWDVMRPAADSETTVPTIFLDLPTASGQPRGHILSDGMRAGDILRQGYGVDPAWVKTHDVDIVRLELGKDARRVDIGWVGIARQDKNAANPILKDGDTIRILPKPPANDPAAPKR